MSNIKIGSEIDFHIIRDGKEIHHHIKLHNILASGVFAAPYRLDIGDQYASPIENCSFCSRTSRVKTTLNASTWSQSGLNIIRNTGSETIPAGASYISWPGGVSAGYVTNAGSSFSEVSKSLTISPTTGLSVYKLTGDPFAEAVQLSTGVDFTGFTYVAGVSTISMSAIKKFPLVVTPYTLRSIMLYSVYEARSHYDLPADIALVPGDQIVVTALTYIMSYGTNTPISFSTCPITGITATGRMQKLLPSYLDYQANFIISGVTIPNRLYIVTTPNTVTLPTMPSTTGSVISSGTITAAQSLVADGSHISPLVQNAATSTFVATASIVTTQTDVKQIYLGNETLLYAVIEFDTPITVTAGKVLTMKAFTSMDLELPIY